MSKVSLRGICKYFGDVQVVKDIDLEVPDKEFVSFLGPSGCGKTTTLRMIAGFDMPTKGDIYIGDRLVSSVSKKIFLPPEERNIGMVFQNYAVWPHMSVFDNVAYPLKIKKMNRKVIREQVLHTLTLVKLEGLDKRQPHQLSGGQQQRVALARALVMEPDVMLLDEPLSNLDAKLREEMRFEIKEIQSKFGVTIIYVTHDQAEAMAMSDRIMLLHQAKIQQLDCPQALYEKPSNRFVADFIGLINFIPAKVVSTGESVDGQRRYAILQFKHGQTLEVKLPIYLEHNCILGVRPENIELVNEGTTALEGEVRKRVYLGNSIEYRVLFGEQELRVEAPPALDLPVYSKVGIKFSEYVAFGQ